MSTIIRKSSQMCGFFYSIAWMSSGKLMRIPMALVEAIEKHALGD